MQQAQDDGALDPQEVYEEMLGGERATLIGGAGVELGQLGGVGAELTTGLILTWRDRIVFGVVPSVTPIGAVTDQGAAAFLGIGGHLEADEQWGEAVIREAQEEASCPIVLGDSAVTYFCEADRIPSPIAYRWSERYRPLLVWVASFNLRRGPGGQRVPVTLVNAVFRAAALSRPHPGAEIPALLLLDQDTLLHALEAPRTVAQLEARGCQLIGQPLAPDTLLGPGGTAYFYARWLAWQQR